MGSRLIDIAGQRFGNLVAMSRNQDVTNTKGQKPYWNCICDCGSVYSVLGSHLRSGKTTKCFKCSHEERGLQRRKYAAGEIPVTYWNTIVEGARLRDIVVDITPSQVYSVFKAQLGKCALSGVPISFRDDATRKHSASLDRIDSSKGYVEGNIQWVHKVVNMMKRDLPEDELLDWCRKIISNATTSSSKGWSDSSSEVFG